MGKKPEQIGRRQKAHLYIEEWMEARGLKDDRLADRIGVSRVTVTRWRSYQHRLNPDKIGQLAHALDIEPEDLFRPPSKPSVDAMLRGRDADLWERAAEAVTVVLKTGTR